MNHADTLRFIHDSMVKARVEALARAGEAGVVGDDRLWVVGVGQEAVWASLGLQLRGEECGSPDIVHLHPGAAAADGALTSLGQSARPTVFRHSGGPGGAFRAAVGSAALQARQGLTGITVATGYCLESGRCELEAAMRIAARQGEELPLLAVMACDARLEACAFDMDADRSPVPEVEAVHIDGCDVQACWDAIVRGTEYVRRTRKPFIVEGDIRSAGPGAFLGHDPRLNPADCIVRLEEIIVATGAGSAADCERVWDRWEATMDVFTEGRHLSLAM